MISRPPLIFKIASEEWEFEQIHKLNYKTFVEEIPQHEANAERALVDKFHQDNKYIICLRDNRLIGMVSIRDRRPFSLDQKLNNLDSYLPECSSIVEIRLLSVEGGYRRGHVLKGLLTTLIKQVQTHGYDLAIISATFNQMKLYKHLGFVPFGLLVGNDAAMFQPMYITLNAYKEFRDRTRLFSDDFRENSSSKSLINLLPGPVHIDQVVHKSFNEIPVSHRSEIFVKDFKQTKDLLCSLVHSRSVEILMGSGSLANDCIAAQLSSNFETGLVLSNGEFGNRLIDHARRFGLHFRILKIDWGMAYDRDQILRSLDQEPDIGWLWAVHCETSTGVLNDLEMLKSICLDRGIRLCLDCVSSIGTIPTDLNGIYLASGVSGKGLGAFPGLSMVFYNHEIIPLSKNIPRYLDIGLYSISEGIPFTISSNLIYALKKALERFDSEDRYRELEELSSWLRGELRNIGFNILAPDEHSSPALITIDLPRWISSESLGRLLEEKGYLLSYRSRYLMKRNWIQISLMSGYKKEIFPPVLNLLRENNRLFRKTI
ncbi:MAG: aminotransferase class V-fold PLP-dependent enzyme [Thermodesulfobacteriota bacterium]